MTPCEKAGLKVGDKIRTLVETHCIRKGTVITLDSDDGSNMPYFTHDNGDSSPFTVTRQWERVMTKPTNKQEALDQIDSLRAYIEDCDKLKRVRVYAKEGIEESSLYITGGKIYDLIRIDRDGCYWVTDNASDSELCCEPEWFVVVEGELPPNE